MLRYQNETHMAKVTIKFFSHSLWGEPSEMAGHFLKFGGTGPLTYHGKASNMYFWMSSINH